MKSKPIQNSAGNSGSKEQPADQQVSRGIKDFIGRASTSFSLSAEGGKYIENLRKLIAERNDASDHFKLEYSDATSPVQGLIVKAAGSDHAVFILFAETYALDRPDWVGHKFLEIHRAFSELNIIDVLVIQPEDYGRYGQTVYACSNMLKFYTGEFQGFNAQVLASHEDRDKIYNVVVDRDRAVAWLNQNSPHQVRGRAECGLILTISKKRGYMGGGQRMGMDEEEILGAITGYLEAFPATNGNQNVMNYGQPSYNNLCVVSECMSILPTPDMAQVLLAFFTNEMLMNNGALVQYQKFGKGDPNVGSLIASNDEPNMVTDFEDLKVFWSQYFADPRSMPVVFNAILGRLNMPGLQELAFGQGNQLMISHMADFFGMEPSQFYSGNIVHARLDEVWGIAEVSSHKENIDSAYLDYMYMVANGHKPSSALNLLYRNPQDASARFNFLKDKQITVRTGGFTCGLVFEPQWIQNILNGLVHHGVQISVSNERNNQFGLPQTVNINTGMFQGTTLGAGPMVSNPMQGFNPSGFGW